MMSRSQHVNPDHSNIRSPTHLKVRRSGDVRHFPQSRGPAHKEPPECVHYWGTTWSPCPHLNLVHSWNTDTPHQASRFLGVPSPDFSKFKFPTLWWKKGYAGIVQVWTYTKSIYIYCICSNVPGELGRGRWPYPSTLCLSHESREHTSTNTHGQWARSSATHTTFTIQIANK